MNANALKDAGLTDGEIKVYLALLEIGSTTVGPVIEKSGIARSISYQILDKLIKKGLVSYITKEKTRYYQAADPRKILDYMDERSQEIEENKKAVEQFLPRLLLLRKSAPENEVNVYEGFKGMVTVHERTYEKLRRGEEYFYLGIYSDQPEFHHAYWRKDHKRRAKAGIKCKLLFNVETERKYLDERNATAGCDARWMPLSLDTPAWILGYKDVTVIGLAGGKKAISIEIINQDIADSFRAYFETFWKDAKKL